MKARDVEAYSRFRHYVHRRAGGIQLALQRMKEEGERYDAPMVDPGGDYPGGGGGSPPPPSQPGANPLDPPSAAPQPGGPEGGPGGVGDVGPAGPGTPVGGAVRYTSEDPVDGHRHRIVQLLSNGMGATTIDAGPQVLPHGHNISNWQVIPRNVAGTISEHPGKLYPGEAV